MLILTAVELQIRQDEILKIKINIKNEKNSNFLSF